MHENIKFYIYREREREIRVIKNSAIKSLVSKRGIWIDNERSSTSMRISNLRSTTLCSRINITIIELERLLDVMKGASTYNRLQRASGARCACAILRGAINSTESLNCTKNCRKIHNNNDKLTLCQTLPFNDEKQVSNCSAKFRWLEFFVSTYKERTSQSRHFRLINKWTTENRTACSTKSRRYLGH